MTERPCTPSGLTVTAGLVSRGDEIGVDGTVPPARILSWLEHGRWQAIHQPFTLVAVFGSWCADSHLQLPDLLALEAVPTPFIEIHYLGVNRDKQLEPAAWPAGCAPQVVARVPTFYLFATQPGGKQQLVGSVVENPPRPGQIMAEALVELVEAARP